MLVHAKVIDALLEECYKQVQPYIDYALISPYKNVVALCETKVDSCLKSAKFVSIHAGLCEVVETDFKAILDIM